MCLTKARFGRILVLFVLCLGSNRPVLADQTIDYHTRFDLAHIYSWDSLTSGNLSLSQMRINVGFAGLGVEGTLDARGWLSWNSLRDDRLDIIQAFGQLNFNKLHVALGRQVIPSAGAAQVDGLRLSLDLGSQTVLGAFLGLLPHPLTRDFNLDFFTLGLTYAARGSLVHQGGLVCQLYNRQLDRLYLHHQLLARIGDQWSFFGLAVIDLTTPRGVIGDLLDKEMSEQSRLERIDITRAQMMVRYRSLRRNEWILRLSHQHTIIPSLWWRDWIEQERQRLGFTVDGPEPVGTRRSSLQLTANFPMTKLLKLYSNARLDMRHVDEQIAYGMMVGLKLDSLDWGYVDVYYHYRRYYLLDNQSLSARGGWDLSDWLGLDWGAALMYSRPTHLSVGDFLADLDLGLWWNLGGLAKALQGFRILLHYQTFIEPEMVLHMGHLMLSYRLRSKR